MISVDAGGAASDGVTRDAIKQTALFKRLEARVGEAQALQVAAGSTRTPSPVVDSTSGDLAGPTSTSGGESGG